MGELQFDKKDVKLLYRIPGSCTPYSIPRDLSNRLFTLMEWVGFGDHKAFRYWKRCLSSVPNQLLQTTSAALVALRGFSRRVSCSDEMFGVGFSVFAASFSLRWAIWQMDVLGDLTARLSTTAAVNFVPLTTSVKVSLFSHFLLRF